MTRLLVHAVAAAIATLVLAVPASADPLGPIFRITHQGTDGDQSVMAAYQDIAFNSRDNQYMVAWMGDASPSDGVFGQRIDLDGNNIGDVFPISAGGFVEDVGDNAPIAMAYNPQANQYLVTWDAGPDTQIVARLMNADGSAASGEIQLSDVSAYSDIESVVPVYSPEAGEFLVVWKADRADAAEDQVYGQRVNAAGSEVGTEDFQVSQMDDDADDAVDVAYNATDRRYLVVWHGDDSSTESFTEVYGQLLNLDGSEFGPDFQISNADPAHTNDFYPQPPRAAWNSRDNQWLVTWAGDHQGSGADDEQEVWARRLDNVGNALTPQDFRLSDMGPDSDPAYDAFRPDIAYNPNANEWMLVWHGDDNTPPQVDNEAEVWGQRLAADLTELGTNDFRISQEGPDGDTTKAANRPTIAYNSARCDYMAAWGTGNNRFGNAQEWEIFGRRVAASPCPPPPPPPAVTPNAIPSVLGVSMLRRVFAVAKAPTPLVVAQRRRRAKRGSEFRYTVSEPVRVTIRIERAAKGKRVGRRCRRPSSRLRKRRNCTRYVRAGTLTRNIKAAGRVRTRFTGRIGRRALKPARYRATIQATDAAGARSGPRRITFRIVRR